MLIQIKVRGIKHPKFTMQQLKDELKERLQNQIQLDIVNITIIKDNNGKYKNPLPKSLKELRSMR